ncbi:hypothetical protein Ae201684P_007841 [Aphanomyces euteiches]|nr:hypothetical protein Ae201684P_007841 [Aphanomyces euteiches]
MRLFVAVVLALVAVAAGSRTSFQTSQLASFKRSGQTEPSRVLLQAEVRSGGKQPKASTKPLTGQITSGYSALMNPATRKSLGLDGKQVRYRDSQAFKGSSPEKSPLGPGGGERRSKPAKSIANPGRSNPGRTTFNTNRYGSNPGTSRSSSTGGRSTFNSNRFGSNPGGSSSKPARSRKV